MTDSPRRDGTEPTQPLGGGYPAYTDPAYSGQSPYGPPYQAPAVPNPASAPSQVRWRAVNATLTGLNTASTPDRAAFVMDVQAAAAWSLDIETSSDWQLTSAVLCDMASADVLSALGHDVLGSPWDM